MQVKEDNNSSNNAPRISWFLSSPLFLLSCAKFSEADDLLCVK